MRCDLIIRMNYLAIVIDGELDIIEDCLLNNAGRVVMMTSCNCLCDFYRFRMPIGGIQQIFWKRDHSFLLEICIRIAAVMLRSTIRWATECTWRWRRVTRISGELRCRSATAAPIGCFQYLTRIRVINRTQFGQSPSQFIVSISILIDAIINGFVWFQWPDRRF